MYSSFRYMIHDFLPGFIMITLLPREKAPRL